MILVFDGEVLPEELRLNKEQVIEIMRELYKMTEDELFISLLMGIVNHKHQLNISSEEFLEILEEIKK